jgi:hypothetical protein
MMSTTDTRLAQIKERAAADRAEYTDSREVDLRLRDTEYLLRVIDGLTSPEGAPE